MEDNMELKEAIETLRENGFILEDKAADDYGTFEEYLKDFKEELLFQYMTPEIGERKYQKIISNEQLLQEIKDNWSNGDYCPSEMVEYILDNDLVESYKVDEDFTQGVGAPLGADQGIPHSMQGCAVPMMRIGEPAPMGKIQKPHPHCPPPPPYRRPPIGVWPLVVVNNKTSTKKKKRKKKKSKK
jgi:hypothetical protein